MHQYFRFDLSFHQVTISRLKNKQEELEKLLQMYENHSPIINPGV